MARFPQAHPLSSSWKLCLGGIQQFFHFLLAGCTGLLHMEGFSRYLLRKHTDHLHVCSPVREHVFLLVTFNQKRADVQDPSNNFIANTPLGFRKAVPCYRTTTWWRLDGTSRDCLVQQPCSKQAQLKRLAQAVSSWVCNTWKDGDSATSLACSLFSHCHREKKKKWKGKKKIFLLFKWNFLCSVCAHCLLYFYWASLNRVWLCLPYSLLDKITPAIQPQVSHPLLIYARCSKRWPFPCAHSSLVLV